jgi:two-component system chemotaxis response regulator CheB
VNNIGQAPDGEPASLVRPECHGPLWGAKDGKLVRYQCLVGHRYSSQSLLAAHNEGLETALWIALRTLEERVLLQKRLAEQSQKSGRELIRQAYLTRSRQYEKHALVLRRMLEEFR